MWPFAHAPPPSATPTGPRRPARERCRAASFPKASAIPRSADRLVAVRGRLLGRIQQTLQALDGILPNLAAQVVQFPIAKFYKRSARGNALLDGAEGLGVIGLALRRHHVLVAAQALLQARRVEIDAAAVVVDVLAAARGQHGRRLLEFQGLLRRRKRRRQYRNYEQEIPDSGHALTSHKEGSDGQVFCLIWLRYHLSYCAAANRRRIGVVLRRTLPASL